MHLKESDHELRLRSEKQTEPSLNQARALVKFSINHFEHKLELGYAHLNYRIPNFNLDIESKAIKQGHSFTSN